MSAYVIQAVKADLGRARQEELPLSNVDERGRSYIPPRTDESRHYDPKVKEELGNKWLATIQDEESEQMRGLTDLNARPWASTGPPLASRFDMPKLAPAAAAPARSPASAPGPKQNGAGSAPRPVTQPSPKPAAAQQTERQTHILDRGKCRVSLYEGQTVVPDANYCIEVSVQSDAAFLILTAPGKPAMSHSVLSLEAPIVHGTSCIISTKPGKDIAANYTIKPEEPATADKLARVLQNIQIALQKELCKSPATTPAVPQPSAAPVPPQKPAGSATSPSAAPQPPSKPVSSTPTQNPNSSPARRPVQPPRSLLCDKSPDSSPDTGPEPARSQLVEVAVPKRVTLDQIIDSITVIVRNAYHHTTGSSAPMSPSASVEEPGDIALGEWLQKGHIDSEDDETKRVLLEIMRFLNSLRLKSSASAASREPTKQNEVMQVLKALQRGGLSYSAPELLQMKKDAVMPKEIKKGGLENSLWAKKQEKSSGG